MFSLPRSDLSTRHFVASLISHLLFGLQVRARDAQVFASERSRLFLREIQENVKLLAHVPEGKSML